MKINRVPSSNMISQYIHVKENVSTQTQVQQSSDKVELTNESQTFSAALKQAKEAIETRSSEELNKISQVKDMVSEGSYEVSGEDVAGSILGID